MWKMAGMLLLLSSVFICLLSAFPVPDNEEWIDLTYPLNNETLNFITAANYRLLDRKVYNYKGIKYVAGEFCSGEHVGTHMDAPMHYGFDKNMNTLTDIPMKTLQGPAVVVNIAEKAAKDRDALLTQKDLENWEAQNGKIPDGSIVLMNSGWGKYYNNVTAFFGNSGRTIDGAHYPGFGEDAAKFLVEQRNINGIGVDTPSLDTGISETFPAHYAMAFANKYGLEFVANLDKLPPSGAHLYILPIKLDKASGAPTRIMAHLPKSNPV